MVDKHLRFGLWLSGIIVAVVCLLGVLAPFVPYVPEDAVDYGRRLQAPSWAHLFGTDAHGRDVAFRIFKGTEAFFFPGLIAALIATLCGAAAGAAAGYSSGALRNCVTGAMQLIDTLPSLVFIILVCTIFAPSMYLIAFVTGVLFTPTISTVIQRRVEALGSEDYILAHIAHGFGPVRILTYHILWLQCRPLLLRQATYVFGYVIFVETALSYLGDYGVQEPLPSWGNMIAQARGDALVSVWHWLIPGLAIIVTIAAFLSFGNLLARKDEVETQ